MESLQNKQDTKFRPCPILSNIDLKNYLFADMNRKLMYCERGGEWTNWGKETSEKRCKQERQFDLRGLVSNDCQCTYMHFWLPWSVISTTLPGLGDCDVALPCSCGLASWLRCSPPSSTFSTFSTSCSSSSTSLRPQPREGVSDGTVPLSPPLPHSLAGDLHIWSEMMGTFTIVKKNLQVDFLFCISIGFQHL